MEKNPEGIWSATTEPLKPDLYGYSFVVDGLSILDPGNTRFRPSYRRIGQSAVLVPGDMPWTPLPNALRGTVSHHFFHSAVANDERDFYVYTPPNYDPKRKQPYPVLFLLHGLGDDANAWIEVGAANVTLDTLINQGKAEPMIMVNPLGYGNSDGPAGHLRPDMLPAFVRILIDEVMPQVERQYNVSARRTDRAIAGLSMGGAEATLAGLNHLDKFAWIGSFSGAYNLWPLTRPPEERQTAGENGSPQDFIARLRLEPAGLPKTFPGLDAGSNREIKLLWIACGTADVLLRVNREFKAYLDSKGVKATFTEVPDQNHVWPLWRQNLADFARFLFR
jgi:enterochelin esterase family protein